MSGTRALAIATFLADLSALPSESSQSSIQVTDSEEIWQEIGNSLSSLGGKQPPEWGPVAALLCNPKLLLQRLTAPKKRPGGSRANPAKGPGRSIGAGLKEAAHFGETAASLQEQSMMQTLQSLEFGTWLEFCPDPNSKPERHKLSWHSSMTGRCMFVDRTGVKSKEADILWLAREVLAKRARIVEVGREPFFERALKSILRMLKGSADTNG